MEVRREALTLRCPEPALLWRVAGFRRPLGARSCRGAVASGAASVSLGAKRLRQ